MSARLGQRQTVLEADDVLMATPNSVVPSATYIAILKAKRGELTAVGSTPPERFIPLLEVVEPTKYAPPH